MCPCGIVIVLQKVTNSVLLDTWESVLPTSGDKTFDKNSEKAYVGEEMNETIGLIGIPVL